MSNGKRELRKRAEQIARDETAAANRYLESLANKPEDEVRSELTRWLRMKGWKSTPKEIDEWVAALAEGELPSLTGHISG